jgi:hypothetical protein
MQALGRRCDGWRLVADGENFKKTGFTSAGAAGRRPHSGQYEKHFYFYNMTWIGLMEAT